MITGVGSSLDGRSWCVGSVSDVRSEYRERFHTWVPPGKYRLAANGWPQPRSTFGQA